MSETTANEIESALRSIAFGSPAGAIKLLLRGEELTDRQIRRLDLNLISDIKKSSGGITEIKFYDRIKALSLLSDLSSCQAKDGSGFINALRSSAESLPEDEDDEFCV